MRVGKNSRAFMMEADKGGVIKMQQWQNEALN
jgi:hypothetical protein